ncbi:MAG: dipeptidyl aminopeptidase/acylaminoacyl peptidase [Lysobacterales bacterium]|jgi:dipeptidyl aminopeptidase/acylaminoacyl peptidase
MMRCLTFVAILTLTTSHNISAQEKPAFSAMDVFELEWATQPQFSPDGSKVVYIRNSMDIMQDKAVGALWVIGSDGKGHRKLTNRDIGESNPRWSLDGTRIAFISMDDVHGSELFIHWVEDNRTARISQLDRSASDLQWSPDGTMISFTMLIPEKPPVLVKGPEKPKDAEWAEAPQVTNRVYHEADGSGHIEPGFQQLFTIPADGGTPRQITSGEFQHNGQYSWAADGNSIVFSANRHPDHELAFRNTEIYKIDTRNLEITALTDRFGPDHSPAVSPDGKKIVWAGFDDKVQAYQADHLYVMDIDGGNVSELSFEPAHSPANLAWARDGKGIYFQYDHHGNTKIGYTSLSGKFRQVAANLGGTSIGRPYGGGSFHLSGTDSIVFTHTTPYHPSELAVVGRGGKSQLISSLNDDVLGQRTLGQVEEVWYQSSFDGRDIQGWIAKPPGYEEGKTYPLLVENHGGPISNYGDRFSPEIQLYASAGYVVFYPNPRGSTSYGEEFANLLYNNYPGEDYQDVMDGVDAMIAAGYTSEEQLYVTGGSAGGIMTAWIVGKNHRFEAAVVAKPVMNWISKLGVADNYFRYAEYRYPGQIWENMETYWKHSPLSLVGNIETPTMVMVGTADLRTPLSEAKQLYHALKIREIDTALVEIPGASHLIVKRPSQLITKVQHVLAWFEKYPPQE